MTSLHPVFRGILAGLGMPEQADAPLGPPASASDLQERASRQQRYIAALQAMDWTFEHSDCHTTWCRGRDELKRLRAERAEVDPTGLLWKQYAHPDYRS